MTYTLQNLSVLFAGSTRRYALYGTLFVLGMVLLVVAFMLIRQEIIALHTHQFFNVLSGRHSLLADGSGNSNTPWDGGD